MSLTPEQQADFDYAMSQLNPKGQVWDITIGSMPMITLKVNAQSFSEASASANRARQIFKDDMQAAIVGGMIPKHLFTAPNCRCVITEKPNESQKD